MDEASQERNTSGKERNTARKSDRSLDFWRGVEQMGRSRLRGEQIVSWTRLASVQHPRMYAVSVGFEWAIEDESSVRSSTLTSVCVADGGRDSRTVRNVSCKRTACQSFLRSCFSKIVAVGQTILGSRCKPMAYAWRIRTPANAQPSEAWLSFMRK